MATEIQQLTSNAIQQLISGDAEEQEIIVQIFNITKTKTGRLICFISDGSFSLKAYITDDQIIKPNQSQNAIIAIKSHGALKSSIGITKLKLVGSYKEKIGNPDDWNKYKENGVIGNNEQTPKKFKIDTEKLIVTQKKTNIKAEVINGEKIKTDQYEKIDDLYIGLKRFTLLCRITRKILKQSMKKGTKILEIELVDKSKKKIIGTFFGQCTIEFNDYLKEGCVYEISKGYIREGNYNNSGNEMLSPYTLVFDEKSTFNEVSDFNIIVKSEDTAITLGQVYQRHIFHQQYDVVAYVCQIKDQVTFQKNDKSFSIRQVIVADPYAEIMMAIKLWRWNHELPMEMVGKVVIFSRFALKENKGSVFLSSNINSNIIVHHEHPMKKYEGSVLKTDGFKMTTQSQIRRMDIEENPAEFCYNTKELQKKIEYMSDNETIISILNINIARFAFAKKWFYDACPKCNKAAQKYNKCANCDFAVEETNLRFVLRLEASDFCGSLWLTAYDEFARKIFFDLGKNAIPYLQELDKEQLSEISEKYAFQSFRIKIITKKDNEGRVKHATGQLYEVQEERLAVENLKLIQEIMSK